MLSRVNIVGHGLSKSTSFQYDVPQQHLVLLQFISFPFNSLYSIVLLQTFLSEGYLLQ